MPTLSTKMIERLATALTLVMVVVFATQLAWWGWHFLAPPSSASAVAVNNAVDLAEARNLFGPAEPSPATPSAPAATQDSGGNIRLKGVFAVDGKTPSVAVLSLGGRDMAVKLNDKISDGITLVDVQAEHIVITRNGVREKIELDRLGLPASTAASATTTGSVASSRINPNSNANFRLNVSSPSRNTYALSRGELNSVLQDPRQINFLGSITNASGGGVQVQDASPGTLANKLGLQPGDIITQINGQPVNGAGDLARFYGQFGTTSSVRAEVKRGGTPILLTYTINQ
jgi:general secretion pathway protein C